MSVGSYPVRDASIPVITGSAVRWSAVNVVIPTMSAVVRTRRNAVCIV